MGNVKEWTWDAWAEHPSGRVDPAEGGAVNPGPLTYRTARGCAWDSFSYHCRLARRSRHTPGYRMWNIGCRVARST